MSEKKYRIIDTHCHIYPEKIREKAVFSIADFYNVLMEEEGSPEQLLTYKEKLGVEKFCILSVATFPHQVSKINDFALSQMKDHDEFIVFATMHPDMEEEAMKAEIDRIIADGFAGIKFHPDFQKFDIDSPNAIKLYEYLDGRLPIYFHMGDFKVEYSSPERLANMIEMFPNQTFIGAHFGGYNDWKDAEKYLIGKNIYIDTSSSLFKLSRGKAVELIRKHGVDKVMYATDYPMWNPEEELNRFMNLPLTEEEREAILFNNAARLFNVK